jgi:methylamine methyltransferase corrinoid protein reductive activase
VARIGIALDLGTSGFRGQALDLDQNGMIISTAVTTRHPLPGANVMDHLHFAIEQGLDQAHEVIINAVNKVIDNLRIKNDEVVRLAVCGNPIQLSLFQKIEIRDLAYAGKHKLEALGVVAPKRDAQIIKARQISGLNLSSETDILIPPAVRHEVGADALAMMIQTGMLEKDQIAIATDYGTNAEMALIVNGIVYTGSTAAGPALEGQHIKDGLLALPHAICDVVFVPDIAGDNGGLVIPTQDLLLKGRLKTFVLNKDMEVQPGDTIDPATGDLIEKGKVKAAGITGTGVVALIDQGIEAGLIRLPKIMTLDAKIHLSNGVTFIEKDLKEAGKAIGAIRAGHIGLCQAAKINLDDIETAYMCGASGTYVDALKAQKVGMVPKGIKKIYQVGNSSLAMACDMVRNMDELWHMEQIANELRQHHCMFADSKTFEKIYILELSYWTEGMPMDQYHRFLKKFGLPPLNETLALNEARVNSEVIKTVHQDIPDLGIKGLGIIFDIGEPKTITFNGCTGCSDCIEECPENALCLEDKEDCFKITMDIARCNGLACCRCEKICGENIFILKKLYSSKDEKISQNC